MTKQQKFRDSFLKIKYLNLNSTELEVKSKNHWLKLKKKHKFIKSEFGNVNKESIEIPKSIIDVNYPLFLINTTNKDGFQLESKMCLFAKSNMAFRILFKAKKTKNIEMLKNR